MTKQTGPTFQEFLQFKFPPGKEITVVNFSKTKKDPVGAPHDCLEVSELEMDDLDITVTIFSRKSSRSK